MLYLRSGFADVNLVPSYLFCFACSAKVVVVFDHIVEELIFYSHLSFDTNVYAFQTLPDAKKSGMKDELQKLASEWPLEVIKHQKEEDRKV